MKNFKLVMLTMLIALFSLTAVTAQKVTKEKSITLTPTITNSGDLTIQEILESLEISSIDKGKLTHIKWDLSDYGYSDTKFYVTFEEKGTTHNIWHEWYISGDIGCGFGTIYPYYGEKQSFSLKKNKTYVLSFWDMYGRGQNLTFTFTY